MALKVCVFYCSNSPEKDVLEQYFENVQDYELHTVSLPCSGKITIPYMVKAFETGAEGLVIITCKEGDCHNLEGNLRAQKRSQAVDALLEEVGLGNGRIKVIALQEDNPGQITDQITDFCNTIQNKSNELINQKSSISQEKTT